MNKYRLVYIVLVFVLSQACSRSELKAQKLQPVPEQGVSTEVPTLEKKEIKVGDNLTKIISKIKVKDSKLHEKSLSSMLSNREAILILVKPGCIFCESLLAVMNSQKTEIKAQLFFVLDAAHAKKEEFKEKLGNNKNINAEWIYDIDNKFHDELGMDSFPRILYLDKKQTVVEHQVGLRLPENKDELKDKEFPVVLQKLSLTTVAWLQSF